ncbi:hypothetical protein E2C01_086683 [Portunus trituberculatus]|uniref:Uncharacterized protein n=1 Tax=Portunus trituberculatus TaxID=210409 RepID=A0A5B7JB76_PORTR|nr:hypothetical protein [Portunus trituberculatus]
MQSFSRRLGSRSPVVRGDQLTLGCWSMWQLDKWRKGRKCVGRLKHIALSDQESERCEERHWDGGAGVCGEDEAALCVSVCMSVRVCRVPRSRSAGEGGRNVGSSSSPLGLGATKGS